MELKQSIITADEASDLTNEFILNHSSGELEEVNLLISERATLGQSELVIENSKLSIHDVKNLKARGFQVSGSSTTVKGKDVMGTLATVVTQNTHIKW